MPKATTPRSRYRPERVITILELYESGLSVETIMDRMGLAKATVLSYICRARKLRGTQPRGPNVPVQPRPAREALAATQAAAITEYHKLQWLNQYHALRMQRDRFPSGSEGWFSYDELIDQHCVGTKRR